MNRYYLLSFNNNKISLSKKLIFYFSLSPAMTLNQGEENMDALETLNAGFIDQQYRQWKQDPNSVSRDWQFFFMGFEIAGNRSPAIGTDGDPEKVLKQAKVEALKYRYRDLGHLLACMDPLEACPIDHPLLRLETFGLTQQDLEKEFFTRRFAGKQRAPLKKILEALKETYCRAIGVEFMHLQDPAERRWLQDRMEPNRNRTDFGADQQRRILKKLIEAELFEAFLNQKYIGVTRFSLQGASVIIPLLDVLIEHAAGQGIQETILGTAHRGRLNIQSNILGKPFEEIFSEFESCYDPGDLVGAGDVKYHNGFLADVKTATDQTMRIFLVNNPSHLEAVNPVVEGFSRARQDMLGVDGFKKILPLLIHGDAAFAGQGIVAETLNLSQLKGYHSGGTVHIVINNQIGYTTLPADARSTRYATDVAKMLMVPIFHVHGENPEAAIHVARIAADYRQMFAKDVVIDVVCYRRYGHNEGDEPYFTQPLMYDRIRKRLPLNRVYGEQLLAQGVVTQHKIEEIENQISAKLEKAYETIHGSQCPFPEFPFYEHWQGFHGNYSHELQETGVDPKRLLKLARKLKRIPADFTLFSKLQRLLKKRLDTVEQGSGIDWSTAEALAFASLLTEGLPIRLSGQDAARGTFSQRHSVLVDTRTGAEHISLNTLENNQAAFAVYNSSLSEVSVLGFEYGYSMAQPRGLVIWEAQFGDFINNAQSVIDLFIASGESKWQRLSGLVLLLPHGLEGLGPEHSSARLERFLQLCAGDNIQVCNATTPAQYFHLLRRQAKRQVRKPLVIMTPKSLLRHPLAVSDLSEMVTGNFKEVIDDPANIFKPRRVLVCSGKVYYPLMQRRRETGSDDTVIVRLEQFYPFPKNQLVKIIDRYHQVKDWYWVQEEPQNMGGWQFIHPRLTALTGKPITYIGRNESASPATGFPEIYKREQSAVLDQAIPSQHGDDGGAIS
jgi:2-oxoglutarate dehydrogenase E1 component